MARTHNLVIVYTALAFAAEFQVDPLGLHQGYGSLIFYITLYSQHGETFRVVL
jgi:hypothetical protein